MFLITLTYFFTSYKCNANRHFHVLYSIYFAPIKKLFWQKTFSQMKNPQAKGSFRQIAKLYLRVHNALSEWAGQIKTLKIKNMAMQAQLYHLVFCICWYSKTG